MATLAQMAKVLLSAPDAFICGHIMPDGDALGSVLALGLALENMGKKVTVASPDPVPGLYRFLPGVERIVAGGDGLDGHHTFVALDCSVPSRLGVYQKVLQDSRFSVINIDHHAAEKGMAELSYVDAGAAATGEIIFDLLEVMNAPISRDIAVCLYTALVTDTGSFQYESTSAGTHRRVAALIEHGVMVARVSSYLYEEKALAGLLLLGRALGSLSFAASGRVAWMMVTIGDLQAVGASDEDTESLINYVRLIRGVEVAILFREVEPGVFKIGFRSKCTVDVQKIAGQFGGGGHRRASGCFLQGSPGEVQHRIVEAVVTAVT